MNNLYTMLKDVPKDFAFVILPTLSCIPFVGSAISIG